LPTAAAEDTLVSRSFSHLTGPGADPEIFERGAVRGRSPEPSAGGGLGASAENFKKLDAISCNLAYIFGIRMASDII